MTRFTPRNADANYGPTQAHGRRQAGPRIRWSALATGSLVGIACWAALYLVGAALYWLVPLEVRQGAFVVRALLGLYGAVAASLALAFASFVAARTGGANSQENALLYGLCLWSLAAVTLVTTTFAATCGAFSALSSEILAVFDVGLAAVGLQASAQGTASPAAVLWSMVMTLAVSLIFALRGGRAGQL